MHATMDSYVWDYNDVILLWQHGGSLAFPGTGDSGGPNGFWTCSGCRWLTTHVTSGGSRPQAVGGKLSNIFSFVLAAPVHWGEPLLSCPTGTNNGYAYWRCAD